MTQTAVVDIPINDEAFRRFFELFRQYKTEAAKVPEGWGELNDIVTGIGAGFAAMSAEMRAQNEELEKRGAEERKLDKAERAAAEAKKKQDRDAEQREREAAKRRQKQLSDLKTITSTVTEITLSLGKWAILGGAAGVVGGALSLWGFDRLLHGVSDERRTAQGFGVSVSQRQALSLNMQRYFDVNPVLENLAEAQADPSKRWVFAGMGINPQGKSPAELAPESALAARRTFMQGHGNEAWAQAHGLLDIYTMDDLRRLAATPEADLRGSIDQAKRDAGPGGRGQLADQVAKKWQDLTVVLDGATLKLKNVLLDRLSTLERNGAIDRLIDSFTRLATSALDRIDWDKLGRGIDLFADYIGGSKFEQDFRSFIDNVSYAANKMVSVARFLGLLPDAKPDQTPPSGPGAGGFTPGAGHPLAGAHARNWNPFHLGTFGALKYPWGIDPDHKLAAKNRAAINAMLAGEGWGDSARAGLLANFEAESGLDPFAQGDQNKRTGQYEAYGLGQWHAARQAGYAKLFGHSMQSVRDPAQALREQLAFQSWELTHGFKRAGDALRHAGSKFEAGYDASMLYEKPAGREVEALKRGVRAATVNVTLRNQTGASVATTVNALN